jgi:hypothetical protein
MRAQGLAARARERGRPRWIASKTAREKLRTEVMDITAEARQRLNAFNRDDVEAELVVAGCVGSIVMAMGSKEVVNATTYGAN